MLELIGFEIEIWKLFKKRQKGLWKYKFYLKEEPGRVEF